MLRSLSPGPSAGRAAASRASRTGNEFEDTHGGLRGLRAKASWQHGTGAGLRKHQQTVVPGFFRKGGVNLPPRRRARGSRTHATPVSAMNGWSSGFVSAVEAMNRKLQAMHMAMELLWDWQKLSLRQWYIRVVGVVALALGVATALANLVGVRHVNAKMLPQVVAAVSTVLEREVSVQGVRWVAPTGLLGVSPLASLGGVSVGPGELEHTSVSLDSLEVSLDPLQSLIQRQLILKLAAQGVTADVAQQHNFSWFGFPQDTDPSSRDYLPGLHKVASGASTVAQVHPTSSSNSGSGSGGRFASISQSVQQQADHRSRDAFQDYVTRALDGAPAHHHQQQQTMQAWRCRPLR